MNRFGISITGTYWATLGLSSLAVFAFSILAVFFPSHLWLLASVISMVILGTMAAKSCCDKRNGYPIGRAFLWSYISFVTGSWAAFLLSSSAGWLEKPCYDYSINTFQEGNIYAEQINTAIAQFIEFIQSPGAIFGMEFVHIMYGGIIISLITGAIIKINK